MRRPNEGAIMVDTHTELEASKRFQTPATRRDFLGMAAAWINREGENASNGASPNYEVRALTDLLNIDPTRA